MSTDWSRTFTPGVAPPSHAAPPRPGVLRILYGDQPQQFGDLRRPDGAAGPTPVVLVIHGGAYVNKYHLDLMDGLCDDLTERGVATWNIEYRRVGDPGAEWPGMFLDVAAAADHLYRLAPDYQLDLGRVAALGHSAGGHLALDLAARPRRAKSGMTPLALRGVVAVAPVVNLLTTYPDRPGTCNILMGGSPDEVLDRYRDVSPLDQLPLGLPIRVVVGNQDSLAPGCRQYVARAQALGDPAQLVELPGVDHFEPILRGSPAWERTRRAALSSLG